MTADKTPHRLLALQTLGVAAAYAVLGKFSLLLAIPPGYAAAVWPPSGIAVIAVLVYGYRVWPGVLLGSFIVNASVGLDITSLATALGSLDVPLGIGCGAALQAVTGAYCVRRFAGFPNRLGNEREVFSFLFWAGPASCLVNSLIGTSILLAAGIIPAGNFLINFGTWWIGDTVGVFIFAPLVLVWTLKPRSAWKPRRLTVTVPIVVTFALTVAAVTFGSNWERQRLKLQFDRESATLAPALEKTLANYIGVLHSLAGFHAATTELTREGFRAFVERSFGELVGIQAVSWNPRVPADARAAFEDSARREGFTDFQITERDAGGQLGRAAERPAYVSVRFIEPFEDNQSAIGFDVASNADRRQALERARDTGEAIATNRITLVQGAGQQFGVLVFMPVYAMGAAHDTVEARRQNLTGYMVGVFRGGDIVQGALKGLVEDGLIYRLLDESAANGETFLYENQPRGRGVFILEEKGIFGGSTAMGRNIPITFGGRQWRFEVSPTQEYLARYRQENAWVILISGMLLTSFVAAFVLLVSGRSEELRYLVDERTENLRLSERRLAEAQRIALLGNWDWNVLTNELWWSDEVYRIFDVTPESFATTFDAFLEFVHPDDRDLVKESIDDALRENTPFNIDHRIVLADGTVKFVNEQAEVTFHERRPVRVIGTIQDITERKLLDRMKSEFISTVSHELRTPLTSIKGSLGLTVGGALGALPEKAQAMIDLAYKNTDRLINLVNDILDMEKLDSGRMDLTMETLDLSSLTQEAIDSNAGFASQFGVAFVFTDGAAEIVVEGDRDRLTQVIANLLSNAAKFSPEGGEVRISVARRDGVARVSVSDRGPGIPDNVREHIFERFTQADSSDSRHKGGTGLGLYISKTLIDKHHGFIDFETEVGAGTTFYFELPLSG